MVNVEELDLPLDQVCEACAQVAVVLGEEPRSKSFLDALAEEPAKSLLALMKESRTAWHARIHSVFMSIYDKLTNDEQYKSMSTKLLWQARFVPFMLIASIVCSIRWLAGSENAGRDSCPRSHKQHAPESTLDGLANFEVSGGAQAARSGHNIIRAFDIDRWHLLRRLHSKQCFHIGTSRESPVFFHASPHVARASTIV